MQSYIHKRIHTVTPAPPTSIHASRCMLSHMASSSVPAGVGSTLVCFCLATITIVTSPSTVTHVTIDKILGKGGKRENRGGGKGGGGDGEGEKGEGEKPLIKRTHFVHVFFVLNQERYIFCFANVRNSNAWGRNYKIRPQVRLFDGGPFPHSVYLGRH